MVYRNVLVKGLTGLFSRDDVYSRVGEFVELETAQGQPFFVSRMSVIAICEHGTTLPVEFLSLE